MIYRKYEGNEQEVYIENCSGEQPYTEVGDKAFLSCKSVRKLVLPETITKIGNWGFAHMKQLEELVLPPNPIELGKEVFLDCPKLSAIHILPNQTEYDGLPDLFASAVLTLEDMSLFQPDKAVGADTEKEWFANYDESLLRFLYTPDDQGFKPVLIGWFDDEGEETQKGRFVKVRQTKKARVCLLRLQYDANMSEEARTSICHYMRMHMPGGEKETEHTAVWDLLKTEYGKEIGTVKLLEEAGIIDASLRVLLIDYLNRNQGNPEVLSYLLARQQTESHTAFFAGLEI